ncbi:hypothetical protein AB0D27_11175 [Streptomyces sp. NPDC048415]|uniref:hypothetical protein n=1 Tax=Streptomyces sp. NPDC048415 TaxID=3154822 RepID=UPI00344445BD
MTTALVSHKAHVLTRKRLSERLREFVLQVPAEVRLTPAAWGDGTAWCVMVLGSDRREIPAAGHTRQIARLIRKAFPEADWTRPQNYAPATGVLTEHVMPMPPQTAGRAPGMPLQPLPRTWTDHSSIARTARKCPGQWVFVQSYGSFDSGRRAAQRIRNGEGRRGAYAPSGSFEPVCTPSASGATVWVRYTGAPRGGSER